MTKMRIFLIILVSVCVFLLVYTPHYSYPFPRHIDEWHHITETIKLQNGEYSGGVTGYRLGFHIILLLLSKVANLVLVYRFLPAIWAVLSALVLFYLVYKKTGNQFSVALFAMIFFASIKSNVNITGLWFFTPLTFSIPFIFLYVYFFTEGIEKQNKKLILSSLLIMLLLLPIHSISVLFALPFLLIYALCNFEYIKKEWKFFSLFLIIPIMGVLFYKFTSGTSCKSLLGNLIQALQFRRGWGVLEIRNSFFELYSLVGYILAIMGLIFVVRIRETRKKYLAYGLWPVIVLASIAIYRITGISYLSPYQRNLYYFAISLPILSAFGLDYLLKFKKVSINKIGTTIVLIIVLIFTFKSYADIPKKIALYEVIDNDDYRALLFLSTLPKSRVMAPAGISTAVYPISGHKPVSTYFFYGNRRDVEKFFRTKKCRTRKGILNKYKVKYVLSKSPINCGWELIYDKGDYVYEVN